jgi:hypothetical protein
MVVKRDYYMGVVCHEIECIFVRYVYLCTLNCCPYHVILCCSCNCTKRVIFIGEYKNPFTDSLHRSEIFIWRKCNH